MTDVVEKIIACDGCAGAPAPSREEMLARLQIGDIIHAGSAHGASLICLVMAVSEAAITTRTVTSQFRIEFARDTGAGVFGPYSSPCRIDSVAPLPLAVHDVLLGLDRKMRLELDPERFKLSDDEKRALIYVDAHYRASPI